MGRKNCVFKTVNGLLNGRSVKSQNRYPRSTRQALPWRKPAAHD